MTLERAVERRGLALHRGLETTARLAPAAPGTGWTINGAPLTPALVTDGSRATTLRTPAGPVSTVEHLFAALAGRGIDDVRVSVTGPEVPILDGSAAGWLTALDAAGRVEQAGARHPLRPSGPVEVRRGDAWLRAEPADDLHLRVTIDFPTLGRQTFAGDARQIDTVGDARTFGFAREAEALRARGLAAGAGLDCALVFDDDGRALNGLRHPDEPARHKWLDLLGDLALLGRPLQARVSGFKAGHALHHRLVRALARHPVDAADS